MSKIQFNVDAYTAKLIGRENVSKLEGAILELVKNTYDADATYCILYYDNFDNVIYLIDNGIGMSEEIIVNNWMTIGRSSKKKSYKSDGGRVQTGAKGIGRFALDRIGIKCQMYTVHNDKKLLWNVDWSDFDNAENITDVNAELYEVNLNYSDFLNKIKNSNVLKIVNEKGFSSGTIFKIENLHDLWDEVLFKNVYDSLSTLIPYELKELFDIFLLDNDTVFEEASVITQISKIKYDYKISFYVEEDGKINVFLIRNEFDFGDNIEKICLEAELEDEKQYFNGTPIIINTSYNKIMGFKEDNEYTYKLGRFNGILYFSKAESVKNDKEQYFYKNLNLSNLSKLLGGIKIYKDSFRVRPYGDKNTSFFDWLNLSARKTKSPAAPSHKSGSWRVDSSQITGSILISREFTFLEEQANREGFIEKTEFTEFKNILLKVIELFEKDRQKIFRALRRRFDLLNPSDTFEKEVRKAAKTNENKDKNKKIADVSIEKKAEVVIESKNREIKELQDENKMLRTLATTGILTNTCIHEIKNTIHKLSMKILQAKNIAKGLNSSNLTSCLEQIENIKNSYNSWFTITIDSVRKSVREVTNINLTQYLINLIQSWEEITKNKEINFKFKYSINSDVYFKCYPFDIDSIICNLITNSINSFEEGKNNNKLICIELCVNDETVIIKYEDNGNGLCEEYKSYPNKILESFVSSKKNSKNELIGTGMGMWIVSRIVDEYDGEILLEKNILLETGFYIEIKLKNK